MTYSVREGELPWISRSEHSETQVINMRHGDMPGVTERRIEGVLQGAWPGLGHVRRIPSTDGEQIVTEVTLIITADGVSHPVNPDQP